VVKESEDGEIERAIESVLEDATHYPAALHSALQRRQQQPAVTPRGGEVLLHIAKGRATKEIAKALAIDPRTVDAHRGKIKQRFNLKTGAGLIHFAIEWARNKRTGKEPDADRK
jgi:DNA-binding NarL/FixJ family response regulator